MTLGELLAAAELPDSPTPRLDAEWLLADILGKSGSYLRTWPEREVAVADICRFEAALARRRQGEPVAHILGRQGFWHLELEVSADTLIPRPETELLVEHALTLPLPSRAEVLDLGTGSGAIALALAAERPAWQVVAVDRVPEALTLAERNRSRLALDNVQLLQGSWLQPVLGRQFHLIVSNPPYVCAADPHLQQGDVRFEPLSALVAGADGLDDLRQIVAGAPAALAPTGWLLLEHGYDQAAAVRELLQQRGFCEVFSLRDLGGHERVTGGCWPS